jgi:hypothetical protein
MIRVSFLSMLTNQWVLGSKGHSLDSSPPCPQGEYLPLVSSLLSRFGFVKPQRVCHLPTSHGSPTGERHSSPLHYHDLDVISMVLVVKQLELLAITRPSQEHSGPTHLIQCMMNVESPMSPLGLSMAPTLK